MTIVLGILLALLFVAMAAENKTLSSIVWLVLLVLAGFAAVLGLK